jgi:putative peptidoglycan lipid II flippase
MIRSILTVSTGTLASRLLGFARDAMLAALLGAGPVADAFLAAFQLVNIMRRLLTEGALNAALVPAWLRLRDTDGAAAAAAFAGRVLGSVSAALVVVTLLLGVFMPVVIGALAPGFAGSDTLQLAVTDARLMLPYLAFAGPAVVLLALASAQGRFGLTAFSPLLFNIALIAVMAVLVAARQEPGVAATILAATVGVAGLLQLSVLVLRRRDGDAATPLRVAYDAEMRGFFARALPAMIANSGPQLLAVMGAIIASAAPSAVSWLYFANRLIELPLGIVGVAMGTVLVPELTRALRGGVAADVAHAESRGLELAVGLALPAMVGLIVLAGPIARLLFEHGAFTAADSAATAGMLVWLALGLPAHVLVKALSPAFFAREDTMAPLRATVTSAVVALLLAVLFGHLFGPQGIAAGLACGAWANAMSLIRRGRATFGFAIDAAARRRLPRLVAAALAMGALLWLGTRLLPDWAMSGHSVVQAAALLLLIAWGMAAYALLLRLFGVTGWHQAVAAFRRPGQAQPNGDLHGGPNT